MKLLLPYEWRRALRNSIVFKLQTIKESESESESGGKSEWGGAIYNRVVRNILDRERRFRMRFLVGGMELLFTICPLKKVGFVYTFFNLWRDHACICIFFSSPTKETRRYLL